MAICRSGAREFSLRNDVRTISDCTIYFILFYSSCVYYTIVRLSVCVCVCVFPFALFAHRRHSTSPIARLSWSRSIFYSTMLHIFFHILYECAYCINTIIDIFSTMNAK